MSRPRRESEKAELAKGTTCFAPWAKPAGNKIVDVARLMSPPPEIPT